MCRGVALESDRFVLIEREDMKLILAEEDLAATFSCDDTQCLVDYGHKLQAEKIIHGRINKIGESYIISMKAVDVGSAAIVALRTSRISGDLEQAIDSTRLLVCRMLQDVIERDPS